MSASYGNYLTEEDPNKKKPEGTTPSTTPTTSTDGTTTPPLSFDGFVGTGTGSNAYQTNVGFYNDQYNKAVDTAKTNKDLGMEYIEGVKNSIYGNAAAQRAEADKNTEVARQRGIIDSQSSYQKAVGAYGSNAETLAGRGLSGSGYGEYLTADAYATHRGQVQNINADALRANREAAYAEKQAQMAADSEYLKNLYGINTEFNNAMSKAESDRTTGMYQAALGLNEAQNAAYGKLFDSASKGVSIDAIMQDGTWGDLTPEQQQAITAEAERFANDKSVNEFKGLIDGGTSLEDIQNSEAWSKLTDAQKTDVTNYYNNKTQGATDEQNYINDTNFGNWVTSIGNGSVTLDQIKAMSGYENLTDAQKAQLQVAENNRVAKSGLADKTERADRIVTYGDLARGGMSLDELKATMALYGDDWDSLDPKEQKVIQMAADAYTAAQKKLESEDRPNQIAGLADLAAKGYSIDEIKQWAEIYGITDLSENELAVIQSSADRYTAAQSAINSENERERAYGYASLIEAGWSLDDVKALIGEEEYKKLSPDSKRIIETTASVISKAKTETANKEANAALTDYIELAMKGISIGTIEAIARANGHYDVLASAKEGETSLWQSVIGEATAFENAQTKSETQTNIESAIESGATIEDLENMDGWEDLSPDDQDAYKEQVETRDEEKQTQKEAISAGLRNAGYTSATEVEDYLASEGVPKSERAEYIAQWQSDNSKRVMDSIKLDIFEVDVDTLLDGLKYGAYGEQAQAVKKAYYDAAVRAIGHSQTSLGDVLDLQTVVDNIGDHDMKMGLKEEIGKRLVVTYGSERSYTSDGKPIKRGSAINDRDAISVLDAVASANGSYVEFDGTGFYKKDGVWYEMVLDSSRGYIEPTNGSASNTSSTNASSSNGNGEYQLSDTKIPMDSMNFHATGAGVKINGKTYYSRTKATATAQTSLNDSFPNAEKGTVVTKGNVVYAKLADNSWYIIT